MPKVGKPKILNQEIINAFDYPKTRLAVLDFFSKYRLYSERINAILESYNCSLANDNLGVFSSQISDKTSTNAIKIAEYKKCLDDFEISFKKLKLRMTDDEKKIFDLSILSSHSDEEVAERLSLDKSNIYSRKKSCFIKTALFYSVEVMKEEIL